MVENTNPGLRHDIDMPSSFDEEGDVYAVVVGAVWMTANAPVVAANGERA